MPNIWDATLFFGSNNNEGWSETYFADATDSSTVIAQLVDVADARKALMPPHFSIVGARVSKGDVHGDSYPIIGEGFPKVGSWSAGLDKQLEANTAIIVRLQGTPPHRNWKFLRGLSLDVVRGRQFVAPGGWEAMFDAFAAALSIGSPWQIQLTSDTGIVSYEPVLNVTLAGVSARRPGRPFGAPRGRKFAHRNPTALASAASQSTGSEAVTRPRPDLRSARTRSTSSGSSSMPRLPS